MLPFWNTEWRRSKDYTKWYTTNMEDSGDCEAIWINDRAIMLFTSHKDLIAADEYKCSRCVSTPPSYCRGDTSLEVEALIGMFWPHNYNLNILKQWSGCSMALLSLINGCDCFASARSNSNITGTLTFHLALFHWRNFLMITLKGCRVWSPLPEEKSQA